MLIAVTGGAKLMDDKTGKDEGLIFISWSGEISRQVATALRELIRNTIQTATPWMSEVDIDKGARWRSEIEGHWRLP
jgi:hypothetical protein